MTTLDVVNAKLEANREQSENFLSYLGWNMDQHNFNPDHIYRISADAPKYSSKVFRKRIVELSKAIWGRPRKTLP